MKKLICDVCGTSYADSAEQCPICGCARPADSGNPADPNAVADGEGATYTYVKGGRFSRSNVRKRNKLAAANRTVDPEDEEEYYEGPEQPSSRGLVIAAIVLVLAIIAVAVYIVVSLFGNGSEEPAGTAGIPQTSTQATTTAPTTQATTEPSLNCTGLDLAQTELVIIGEGEAVQINATAQPENTVDVIRFTSANPEIATVSEDGVVTGVAPGETEITVTCGEICAVCKILCQFQVVETTPDGVVIGGNYAMKIDGQNVATRRYKNEVTMGRNESFTLTLVDLDADEILDITWEVGNSNVVKVEGNKVTGVGGGNTKITYTVGDVTYTCIVRVTG